MTELTSGSLLALVPERRLLRQDVFDRILHAIIDGTLPPGARLRDEELTASLNVSRTPLREALTRLEALGLVEMAPNRFTRVTPLREARLLNAIDVLVALYPVAIENAIQAIGPSNDLEIEFLGRRLEEAAGSNGFGGLDVIVRFLGRFVENETLKASILASQVQVARYLRQRPDLFVALGGDVPLVTFVRQLSRHDSAASATALGYLWKIRKKINQPD